MARQTDCFILASDLVWVQAELRFSFLDGSKPDVHIAD